MSVHEKLLLIQGKLKAPKSQYNSFGKYNYRSCEDILEAVKPLCAEQGVFLNLSDELLFISGRFYVKATAVISDGTDSISSTAYAREDEMKKGMDGSQITGCASSYARKYALNGLFLIDDTKDADTEEHKKQTTAAKKSKAEPEQKARQQKGVVNCPICGNILTGYITKQGKEIPPEEELAKLGMCKDCYKAEREINK